MAREYFSGFKKHTHTQYKNIVYIMCVVYLCVDV